MAKIYGKHIANYSWVNGVNSGLVNRKLEIYETKTGLKGFLWLTEFKGWRSAPHRPIFETGIIPFRFDETIKDCMGRLLDMVKRNNTYLKHDPILETPVGHNYGTFKSNIETINWDEVPFPDWEKFPEKFLANNKK